MRRSLAFQRVSCSRAWMRPFASVFAIMPKGCWRDSKHRSALHSVGSSEFVDSPRNAQREAMRESNARQRIIGVSAVGRGIAFAVLEGNSLLAYGTRGALRGNHERALRAFQDLLDFYRPASVILEDWRHPKAKRHPRVNRLIASLGTGANRRRLRVRFIALNTILQSFGPKSSKWRIATVLSERFPELQPRLPRKRKAWESENPYLAVFVALAFAVSYRDATRS